MSDAERVESAVAGAKLTAAGFYRTRAPLLLRLFSRLRLVGECWVFPGAPSDGYGRIRAHGRNHRAHRILYECIVGPVGNLDLDHLCRNRACCNPDHLEPVTRRENLLRGEGATAINAAKTHCPQGHPFNDANTYVTKLNQRMCRVCGRERARERKRKRSKREARRRG